MSNVYSRAHWSYIASDEPQQRPRAVQMPDGRKGYWTPARIPVKDNLYWSIEKEELELLW